MKREFFYSGNSKVLARKPRNKSRSELKPFVHAHSVTVKYITDERKYDPRVYIETNDPTFKTVYGKIAAKFESRFKSGFYRHGTSKQNKMMDATPTRIVWGKWSGRGGDVYVAATKLIKNILADVGKPGFGKDFIDAAVQEGMDSGPSVRWEP